MDPWLAIIRTFCLFALVVSGVISGYVSNAHVQPNESYNVGYRTLDLEYSEGGSRRVLTVAVWYPTHAEPVAYRYGGKVSGFVAPDAAVASQNAPYPLLVFAHGYGGSGISHVFLTEPLAARGWIVVGPDFSDRHSGVRIRDGLVANLDRRGFLKHAKEISRSEPGDRSRYAYRLDQMKLALNRIVKSVQFGRFIDKERIAVGGHSFGGFTALGLCGTIPKRFDPRIKGLLLFSTGAGGYLFTEEELSRVKIPSMYFLGEKEKHERRGKASMAELADKVYRNMSRPKYFLEVKGGEHGSFNNWFKGGLLKYFMGGTQQHFDVVQKYSLGFLSKYVAGTGESDELLKRSDPRLTGYLQEADL